MANTVTEGLDGTPYWKKPEELLPKLTKNYYITYDDPRDEEYLTNATALYNTETGKWTLAGGMEVTPLVWGDPYFFPET